MIELSDKKIVSFDIWDTVLRRKCHPDEIKLYVSRFVFFTYFKDLSDKYKSYYDVYFERCKIEGEIGTETKKTGLDDEYSLYEVNKRLLFNISAGLIEITDSKINELIKIELEQEKRVVYLDPTIESFLSSQNADRYYFISDFYTDKDFIKNLLDYVGFGQKYEDGFVSSEIQMNKRSGNLFKYFHKQHSIEPQNHLHVGDSIVADVESPKTLGILTHHYYIDDEEMKRASHKSMFESRMEERASVVRITQRSHEQYGKLENELYQIGQKYSSIFISYVLAIIEDAVQKGYNKIYYFTREGEFFKEIHDLIVANNPYGFALPKSELLEVSRVATFSASIEEVTLDHFMRLWNQYSTQSMKAFFLSLNIDSNAYTSFFEKYQIDDAEEIQYPWLDKKVKSLFDDEAFCKALRSDIANKKHQLLSYFATKGITSDTQKIYIVDVGWRGTIKDNIATIFNTAKIDGFYFGLFDFINAQRENVEKQSYLSSEEMNRYLRFVSPFEMLCNSANGSVTGYDCSNNSVVVRKINDSAEDKIHHKYIHYFQQGVISSIDEISKFISVHALTAQDLKPSVLDCLKNLMENPPYLLAQAFFELSHNEQFGVGKYVSKQYNIPLKLIVAAPFIQSKRRKLKQVVDDSSWPQGLLIYKRLGMLNRIYNAHVSKVYNSQLEKPIENVNSNHSQLEEQRKLLEERYAAIQEMEQMIIERDHTIQAQNTLLEERYLAMQQMEQMIVERDNEIKELKEQLLIKSSN